MIRPQHVGFALLLLLAGFLFVMQIRASQAFRAQSALPSRRLEDLTVLIRRQQERDRILRNEAAQLQAKLEEYRTAAARGRSLALEMQGDLAQLQAALGLTPVHGPGVQVVLRAGPRRTVVPQAQDLAGLVNEFWAGGAEAVAVNGVRVRASDGIAQQGRGVRVESRVLHDPYRIVGIGDPGALEGALLVRGGPVDGLRGVGLAVTLFRLTDVTLPARAGGDTFRVARPLEAPYPGAPAK